MRPPLTHEQLAAIETRGYDEGGQIHQDTVALVAEIDRLTGERAMLDRLRAEAEEHVQVLIQVRHRYAVALRQIAERCPGHTDGVECTSAIARAALTEQPTATDAAEEIDHG